MTYQVPPGLKPGTWGVAHGGGWVAPYIRRAEQAMSKSNRFPQGDVQASWAGHAFVYVGVQDFSAGGTPDMDHAIVEAEYPKVVMSRASRHSDSVWAVGQPLTNQQRAVGVAKVLGYVGTGYDAASYAWFIAKALQLAVTSDLGKFLADSRTGLICSGVVVEEQQAMGVPYGDFATAATQDADFVCPADLLRWGLDNKWMDHPPPVS